MQPLLRSHSTVQARRLTDLNDSKRCERGGLERSCWICHVGSILHKLLRTACNLPAATEGLKQLLPSALAFKQLIMVTGVTASLHSWADKLMANMHVDVPFLLFVSGNIGCLLSSLICSTYNCFRGVTSAAPICCEGFHSRHSRLAQTHPRGQVRALEAEDEWLGLPETRSAGRWRD